MGQVRDQPQRVLKRAASDVVYEHPDGRAQAARLSALRKVYTRKDDPNLPSRKLFEKAGQGCSADLAIGSDRSGSSSDACTRLCALNSRCVAVSTILRNTKITMLAIYNLMFVEVGPGKCTDSSGRSIKAALSSKAKAQRAAASTTTTTAAPEWQYLANPFGTDLMALLKGPKTSSRA
eukprot:s1494_g4.t1